MKETISYFHLVKYQAYWWYEMTKTFWKVTFPFPRQDSEGKSVSSTQSTAKYFQTSGEQLKYVLRSSSIFYVFKKSANFKKKSSNNLVMSHQNPHFPSVKEAWEGRQQQNCQANSMYSFI